MLSDQEYKNELFNKFQEESLEVIATKGNKDELIAEIRDCYEAIDEILRINGISREEVLQKQKEKKEKRGGFETKCFVKYTENYIEKDENDTDSAEVLEKYKPQKFHKHIRRFSYFKSK